MTLSFFTAPVVASTLSGPKNFIRAAIMACVCASTADDESTMPAAAIALTATRKEIRFISLSPQRWIRSLIGCALIRLRRLHGLEGCAAIGCRTHCHGIRERIATATVTATAGHQRRRDEQC